MANYSLENLAREFRKFRHTMLYLVIVSTISSFVLASYVLAVGTQILKLREADNLGKIALNAATELSKITVENKTLGRVGLIDKYAQDYSDAAFRERGFSGSTSINSVFANLRFADLVADKLNHPLLSKLVNSDLREARRAEWLLNVRVADAMRPSDVDLSDDLGIFNLSSLLGMQSQIANRHGNYVYRDMRKALQRVAREGHLTIQRVNIQLGFVDPRLADGLPLAPPSSSTNIADERTGLYRAGVLIDMPHLPSIMFSPLGTRVRLVNPQSFTSDNRTSVPSAVLVSVRFKAKPRDPQLPDQIIDKEACALIGGPNNDAKPSALILHFPQGMTDVFNSVRDILFCTQWSSNGSWKRAAGGEIPGSGHLVTTNTEASVDMLPSDALAVGVYHWLRTLPSGSDPKRCYRMLTSPWNVESINDSGPKISSIAGVKLTVVNSCLARDSSIRTSNLFEQSGPNGIGQAAIESAFAPQESNPTVLLSGAPQSALPLTVNHRGQCSISNGSRFDEALVRGFFYDVYETNLAALETLSVARNVHEKSLATRAQLKGKLAMEKQELSSLKKRLASLGAVSLEPTALVAKISSTEEELNRDSDALARAEKTAEYSTNAITNANRTADFTYALSANAFSLCRDGLDLLPGVPTRYLIARKTVFTPNKQPASEFDFDDGLPERPVGASSRHLPDNLAWLSLAMTPRFEVDKLLSKKEFDLVLLRKDVQAVVERPLPSYDLRPITVVLETQSASPQGHGKPLLFAGYPQFNVGIPKGQMLYYCQKAITSGDAPKVSWSVLMRDVGENYLEGNLAQPIRSQDEDWCKEKGQSFGVSPGLLCEFQLRMPVPQLKELPIGNVVRNPRGQSALQIPPLPPEML